MMFQAIIWLYFKKGMLVWNKMVNRFRVWCKSAKAFAKRVPFFLYEHIYLGLCGLFAPLVWYAKPYEKDASLIKKWFTHAKIEYGYTPINGVLLYYVKVVPVAAKHMQCYFQGQGVSVSKTSTLKQIVQQAYMTNQAIIAFDQRAVGKSYGHAHKLWRNVLPDLRAQVAFSRQWMRELKRTQRLPRDAKWSIYGLCFGGILAALAANMYYRCSDFSHVVLSRVPTSLGRMLACCSDYSFLLPQLFHNKKDARVAKSQKKSWILQCAVLPLKFFFTVLQCLPCWIKRFMIQPCIWLLGHNMSIVSRDMQGLYQSKKVAVLTVDKDEFVHPRACLSSHNFAKLCAVRLQYHSGDLSKCSENELFYRALYNLGNIKNKFKSRQDFFDKYINEPECARHQSWSQWLYNPDSEVLYSEVDYSNPEYWSRLKPSAAPCA